jgi:hypothetical protein
MEETTTSHYVCSQCGFGLDERKSDESILDHVRSCHGVDIKGTTSQRPFFECHHGETKHQTQQYQCRLVNMQAVQEHLELVHHVHLEKHYFDWHHHQVPPPVLTRVDAEAPCEASFPPATKSI